jgi:hypothetical protein
VFLDWAIEDPSKVQGSPEQVKAAYAAAYQFIQDHIKDLVNAIIGQNQP